MPPYKLRKGDRVLIYKDFTYFGAKVGDVATIGDVDGGEAVVLLPNGQRYRTDAENSVTVRLMTLGELLLDTKPTT